MLDAALKAHSQQSGLYEPMLSDSQTDDEFSIFASQTALIKPDRPFTSPAPVYLQPHSKPVDSRQFDVYPPLPGPLDHPLLPHEPLTSKPVVLPTDYLDHYQAQATFADLSGGWDGLFREVPQLFMSNSTSHTMQPSGEGSMLDDRWASFMHNYSIVTEPSHR